MKKTKKICLVLLFTVILFGFKSTAIGVNESITTGVNENAAIGANENKDNTIVEFTNIGYEHDSWMHFTAADIDGNNLFTVSQDGDYYYFSIYDIPTTKLIKNKKFKINKFPLEYIDGCDYKANGNITVWANYDEKSAIYDSNFKFIKTKKSKNNYDIIQERIKKNKIVTNEFMQYDNFAKCSRVSEFSRIFATNFYDEPTTVYMENEDNGEMYIGSIDKKIFESLRGKNGEYVEMAIYDYANQTVKTAKTRRFEKQNGYLNYGTISKDYAFFVISETDENGMSIEIPFIWKYNESKDSKFSTKKISLDTLKKKNNEIIKKIKKEYEINVLIDKIHEYAYYKLEKGAAQFGTYIILNDLYGFLGYFPKNFTKEIRDTDMVGKDGKFNIYIIKHIKDDNVGAYAQTNWKECLITFQTNSYSATFLPHEFMHIIDQKIYDYYWTKNKYFDDVWNELNPKGMNSYKDYSEKDDIDYDDKHFISYYAMTNEKEDRADTFAEMFMSHFNSYNTITADGVKKKANLIAKSIKEAYPSAKNTKSLIWEKLVVNDPRKIEVKSDTKKVSFTWKNGKGIKGIQFQQKQGSKWKTKINQKTSEYSISKLKPGNKYSFRIRSYKIVKGKTYYGPWTYINVATKPATPKIKNVSKKKNKITVKWKKVECSGYEIQISKTKNFKKVSAKYKVSGKSRNKYTIKKSGKYYVRVRAYKTVDGNKYYSKWAK